MEKNVEIGRRFRNLETMRKFNFVEEILQTVAFDGLLSLSQAALQLCLILSIV
jgi:hypothetical protein